MKILHISCLRELSSGQRKQLTYEYNSSNSLDVHWDVVALHTKEPKDKRFEIQIPLLFRGLFLRNLYGWIYMLNMRNKYDLIINRHMTFDPFVLIFGWFIKNRLSVHHSKEVEELKLVKKGWKGKIASFLESITGKVNLIQVKGAIGVTKDIATYQNSICKTLTFIYPNGIDLNEVHLLEDNRVMGEINIAFVCGTFSSWHGLDLLLNSMQENIEFLRSEKIKIHLIGKVLNSELSFINKHKNLKEHIVLHGLLFGREYTKVLSICNIGLGSFALYRKGLDEAATLKVREYLAYGLPVYSGHIDTAIPKKINYYRVAQQVDIKEIVEFVIYTNTDRNNVRDNTEKYISKKNMMDNLYKNLQHTIKNGEEIE